MEVSPDDSILVDSAGQIEVSAGISAICNYSLFLINFDNFLISLRLNKFRLRE